MRIADTDWDLFEQFQMRTAGFPSAWLESLEMNSGELSEAKQLRTLFQNSRLQEALLWQNPDVAGNILSKCLAQEPSSLNSKTRRRCRKLYAYLQRYCAKNETIGYFGPVAWGRLRADLECPLDLSAAWLEQRTVYLEPWVVALFFRHVLSSPDVAKYFPLRMAPRLSLDGLHLYGDSRSRRRDGARTLSEAEASLLGVLRNRDFSEPELVELGFSREVIGACLKRRWLSRVPPLPSVAQPLDWAQNYLATLPPEIKTSLWAPLEKMREAITALGAARGQPLELAVATSEFRSLVAQYAEGKSTRFQGQAYGSREGYYEDCRRRSLDLPLRFLERVAEPLSLLLESARWMSFQTGVHFARTVQARCGRQFANRGDGFNASYLWDLARDIFNSESCLAFKARNEELGRRWQSIFASRARLSSREVASAVGVEFQVPSYGFPGAGFHSIDLFLGPRGEAVLGEIHPALFPFSDLLTTHQHPRPESLKIWYEKRGHGPEILPAQHLPFTRLAQDGWSTERATHLILEPAWGSWRPPQKRLRLGDCKVYQGDHGPQIRCPEGRIFTVLEFFDRDLRALQALHFSPFAWVEGRPRRQIDDLVVARSTWKLGMEELGQFHSLDSESRHTALNNFFDGLDMPERMFVSFPKEVKPVLLQRRSFLSMDLFWSLFRASQSCRCQEMLPDLEQAWVENPDGLGTSEFRFAVFDQRPYREQCVWEQL